MRRLLGVVGSVVVIAGSVSLAVAQRGESSRQVDVGQRRVFAPPWSPA